MDLHQIFNPGPAVGWRALGWCVLAMLRVSAPVEAAEAAAMVVTAGQIIAYDNSPISQALQRFGATAATITWLVPAAVGKKVYFVVNAAHMECGVAKLEVFDGSSETSGLIMLLTTGGRPGQAECVSQKIPIHIISSTSSILIKFSTTRHRTNNFAEFDSFESAISFTELYDHPCLASRPVPVTAPGDLSSPGFAAGLPGGLMGFNECAWLVTAPPFHRIQVDIAEVKLSPSKATPRCDDELTFYEGAYTHCSKARSYCEQSVTSPPTLLSSGATMLVVLYTHDLDVTRGFGAQVKFLPPEEDCAWTASGEGYRGQTSQTRSGQSCQPWFARSPHYHLFTGAHMPDHNLLEAKNSCRNPNGHASLWCFTNDPAVRWEECDVPRCKESEQCEAGVSGERYARHPIRLVGGAGPHVGVLEVLLDEDVWGAVCLDMDAKSYGPHVQQVACRQLGLVHSTSRPGKINYDNKHVGVQWLKCDGREQDLSKCENWLDGTETISHQQRGCPGGPPVVVCDPPKPFGRESVAGRALSEQNIIIIACVVAGVVLLLVVITAITCCCVKRRGKGNKDAEGS